MARTGTFDADLLGTTAQSYSDKLQVLIGTPSSMLSERLVTDYGRLDDLMAACKRGYSTTIIDAPRIPMDVAADLARLAM